MAIFTVDSNVAQLSATHRTQFLKSAALVLALVVAVGCKKTAVPATQAGVRTDQQVAADIQAKYGAESALGGQNIQVVVQGGVATLNGTVSDNASRALAGNDAGTVDGVKTVINDLLIDPTTAAVVPPPLPRQQAVVEMGRRNLPSRNANIRPSSHRQQVTTPQQQAQQVPSQDAPPVNPQLTEHAAVPAAMPAAPPAPPRPTAISVTVPEGTIIPVRISEALDSAQTQPNDVFHGSIAQDLVVDGMVAMSRGASVMGRVLDARDASHFTGTSLLSLELTEVTAHGRQVSVVSDPYTKEGKARGKNTAEKAGGGAALGAIIGAIAGGGKGAAIGAAAGGGIGAGANGVTRGQQVQIAPETVVNFRLQSPVIVVTSRKAGAPQSEEQDIPHPTLQPR